MAYSERFERAFLMAARLHRTQVRKGGAIPYINHLMAVAALVGSHGGDEDQVIAALLHDAVEDCGDQSPDIRSEIGGQFGAQVLQIVDDCSDTDQIPKPPWAPRKQAYIDHLHALDPGSPTLLVSLADKVHNARSIVGGLRELGPALWPRFRGGRTGSLWYYRALANIFSTKNQSNISSTKNTALLADELRRQVDLMTELGDEPIEGETPVIYFFHGLESGPHGAKYQSLDAAFQAFSPDFQGMDIWARLEKIEVETRQMRDLIVVGSSYGGLLASLLYSRAPQRFRGLVLMAPALHLEAANQVQRLPANTVVIHGRQDTVVPLEVVREKCGALGVDITEVDDDHGLFASRSRMVSAVRDLARPLSATK